VYDKERVDIQKLHSNSEQYMYYGHEWRLVNFKSERHELGYEDDNQFPYISLSLTVRRVSSFYKYMFVGPTILTTVLTLLVLLIPPSSGERFVLSDYGCKSKAVFVLSFVIIQVRASSSVLL
jgi:hypothetical protein